MFFVNAALGVSMAVFFKRDFRKKKLIFFFQIFPIATFYNRGYSLPRVAFYKCGLHMSIAAFYQMQL